MSLGSLLSEIGGGLVTKIEFKNDWDESIDYLYRDAETLKARLQRILETEEDIKWYEKYGVAPQYDRQSLENSLTTLYRAPFILNVTDKITPMLFYLSVVLFFILLYFNADILDEKLLSLLENETILIYIFWLITCLLGVSIGVHFLYELKGFGARSKIKELNQKYERIDYESGEYEYEPYIRATQRVSSDTYFADEFNELLDDEGEDYK